MPLEKYRAKRDFSNTPEPKPKARSRSGSTRKKSPIFVIQEHHASRLHWDFRLEADGVLKSWAVPKEPTLDPSQKRLAVQVEDHPLEYASFEGTIPEPNYGAGTVEIWDHGTYENVMADKPKPLNVAESIDAGHVEVVLHGRKLKGKFALVRMKTPRERNKSNWLLIKMKDEFANPAGTEGAAGSESRTKPRTRATTSSTKSSSRRAKGRPKRSAKPPRTFDDFTHTDKIMFPEMGITKGEVIDFYERIADDLLPFLRDRPVTLERLPDGLDGKKAPHFWQKNTPESYPDWIGRAPLESDTGKKVSYALVNDRASLLYLVNQGTLTFHTWLSRIEDLDHPDFVLFDLDRGKTSFADVVAVAQALHDRLKREKTRSCVKTSGKSGLHVLVPWKKTHGGYDDSRAWALSFAKSLAESLPDLATTEFSKAKRGRRVYIDVMQNARGHHAVPPYVVRAVPEATVSTPLRWNELDDDLDPREFTIKTIFRRLDHMKADPMRELALAK